VSEVREALTAAGASPFLPKAIDPLMLEAQRRYAPVVRAIPSVRWNADQYFFNQRTSVPQGGWVTDGGGRPASPSVYAQNNAQMKHLQVIGGVTGYAQIVTQSLLDLRATEVKGAMQGIFWDTETGCMWGNAASTANGAAPQMDGLDTLVNAYSGGGQNCLDKGAATMTLAHLDELIDMVETNAAMPIEGDDWMFVMSSAAKSKVGQLLLNQQRYEDVTVAAGLIVASYKNVPMMKSTFLSNRSYSVGTVTHTTATTNGALPDATTYKYVLTAVVARQGEIAPSVEVSQTTGSSANTNTITLSFSTATGLDSAQAQLYKVYRTAAGGASNTETFLGYVDGTVGLAADGLTPILTTSIVDTGVALVPQNGSTVPGTLPAQYFGTNAAIVPPALGLESIYLMSRDPNNIIRPYTREAEPIDVYPTAAAADVLPFAIVSDTCLAVRGPKFLGKSTRMATAV
jgi:hypothetical protein